MKFLLVAVFGIGCALAAGLWAGRRLIERTATATAPGVQANARLIGYASVVLLVPLAAEVITGARPGLLAHALIGFLLVPPVLVKLGSVGYRFTRYYAGDQRYRQAGPPYPVMRVLGAGLVLITIVLFASGIELWLFGFRFGDQWATLHKAAFVLWFLAITIHVAAYLPRSAELTTADWRARLPGALTRQTLVIAGLALGVGLLLAMLPFKSPFMQLIGGS